MNDWRKVRALAWTDRLLLVSAVVAMPVVGVMLRCAGTRRSQAVLAFLSRRPRQTPAHSDHAQATSIARQCARLTRAAASRGIYAGNCLERSLVLWWLMRMRGLHGEIRFGARRSETSIANGIEAHAWVEWQRNVVGDRQEVELQNRYGVFNPSAASRSPTPGSNLPV